jgi:hypothetical protein
VIRVYDNAGNVMQPKNIYVIQSVSRRIKRPKFVTWEIRDLEPVKDGQKEPTKRPQTNYLVDTSPMKKRSIQLPPPAASTRIRLGLVFLSVCILVGLVAFFAGANAQVATPIPAATATPAPTATPFPPFAPRSTPRPWGGSAASTMNRVPFAICANDPDRSPFAMQDWHTASTRTGFFEIVGDYFPSLHLELFCLSLLERRRYKVAVAQMSTPTFVILLLCFASIALADDFKTISGKEYKDATVSRVEADGIVIKTKTGLSKIYFAELPKDVQERFHYGSATPTGTAVTQVIDGQSFADKFAERVQKRLDEREAILQGKHTPGPAELSVIREFNFHWVFLAVIAIVAIVLFTVVWRRFQ